jgi:hypothetical protein
MGAVVFSEPPYVTPDRNIIFCSMVIPRFNGDIGIACSITVVHGGSVCEGLAAWR